MLCSSQVVHMTCRGDKVDKVLSIWTLGSGLLALPLECFVCVKIFVTVSKCWRSRPRSRERRYKTTTKQATQTKNQKHSGTFQTFPEENILAGGRVRREAIFVERSEQATLGTSRNLISRSRPRSFSRFRLALPRGVLPRGDGDEKRKPDGERAARRNGMTSTVGSFCGAEALRGGVGS